MNVVIRITKKQQSRALPILLRHSPGMMLRGGYVILPQSGLQKLRVEKVRFKVIGKLISRRRSIVFSRFTASARRVSSALFARRNAVSMISSHRTPALRPVLRSRRAAVTLLRDLAPDRS